MRTATFLLAAFTLASPAAFAQSPSADSATVAATVRQFHSSLLRGDSAAILNLLAEDAVVLEAGGIESRSEYREHHLPADIRFAQALPGSQSAVRVVVVGDVAWATASSEVMGMVEGRAVNSVGAELMVLSRTSSGWQIRAIHWSSRRRANP